MNINNYKLDDTFFWIESETINELLVLLNYYLNDLFYVYQLSLKICMYADDTVVEVNTYIIFMGTYINYVGTKINLTLMYKKY